MNFGSSIKDSRSSGEWLLAHSIIRALCKSYFPFTILVLTLLLLALFPFRFHPAFLISYFLFSSLRNVPVGALFDCLGAADGFPWLLTVHIKVLLLIFTSSSPHKFSWSPFQINIYMYICVCLCVSVYPICPSHNLLLFILLYSIDFIRSTRRKFCSVARNPWSLRRFSLIASRRPMHWRWVQTGLY